MKLPIFEFGKNRALIRVAKQVYSKAGLDAALARFSCQARYSTKAGHWVIEIHAENARELAGNFMNEALTHEYRRKLVRFNKRLSIPLLGGLIRQGFQGAPSDPLEELEPQVKEDREADARMLLKEAALQ